MRHVPVRLATAALVAALVAVAASSAEAHEDQAVAGVRVVVGWADEPTYAGLLNAVQVQLRDEEGPLTDIQGDLRVEVSFGGQSIGPLPLVPTVGTPGEYRATLVPTRPGTYTFRLLGTVRGQAVDKRFTSSPQTFESPRSPAAIEFPSSDPSRGELAARLGRLDPRVRAAQSAARRANALALGGLLVGAAGVVLALAKGRRGGAARAESPAAEAEAEAVRE